MRKETKELLEKIEVLEKRVRELEMRQPTIIINTPTTVYPTYFPQPVWVMPNVTYTVGTNTTTFSLAETGK